MPSERAISRADVELVLAELAEARSVDFRDYAPDPVARGIETRMTAMAAGTAAEYARRLRERDDEAQHLIDAMLVPVSSFFRDPEVFEALAERVIPRLARGLRSGEPLRAWVAGSANGEEAWSVAAILARALDGPGNFRLVASDVAPSSVAAGRRGRYPAVALGGRAEALAGELVRREGDEIVVADALRERVRFEQHDLLGRSIAPKQAVVASFHLVTLRNVLIYFDHRLQRKALERVFSAIEPGGALVLGVVETPFGMAGLEPFPGAAPRLGIYRRSGGRP